MYLERTFLPLFLVVLLTFCVSNLTAQTDADIRLANPVFTGCPGTPETLCLDLQVAGQTNGADFQFGTSSYFIQHEVTAVSYSSWTTSVPASDYSNNPPATNPPGNFNLTVEYVGTAPEIAPVSGWLTVGVICYDIVDASLDPNIRFLNLAGFVGVNAVELGNNQALNNNFPDGESYNGPLECPAIECPTFTSASSDLSEACSGDEFTLSVVTSDNSSVTVNWTLPGGGSATGVTLGQTATAIGVTGCQETATYGYTVVCNDDDSEIATGSIEVEIYPLLSGTASAGGCTASVSQDCPEFTATWDAGGGNTGTGFSFNAGTNESGTVTFTISGGAGAPNGCSSTTVQAAYDCAANCPGFVGASASASAVCDGGAVTLSADVSDESLATIEWTLPGGGTENTFSVNTTANSAEGCFETLTYSYVVTCIDDGSQLASGNVMVDVYAQLSGTASNGGCAASVSQDCPEFVATWDDSSTTGTGFSYSASTASSGTVTFTITNPNAPAACGSTNIEASFDCDANCPAFTGASADQSSVCDGANITISANVDDESLASIVWTLPNGTNENDFSFNTTATSASGCNEALTYSYVLTCIDDGSLISSGNVNVDVFANPSGTTSAGGCAASVSQDCPSFTYNWDDGNATGSGSSYTAGSGESGTVTFEISNPGAPAGCSSVAVPTTYDCAANCPSFIEASTDVGDVCDGGTVVASVSLDDSSLATVNWILPDGSAAVGTDASATVTSASGCGEMQSFSYEVLCNDDNSTIAAGTLSVEVYATITATPSSGTCAASISQDCPEFTATWDDGNMSGSGFSYSASSGSNGTVTFTITNPGAPAACLSNTAQANFDCQANCPVFIDASTDVASVCDGGTVAASVQLNDNNLATVDWNLPDGSTESGASVSALLASTTGCGQTVSFDYSVVCIEDQTVIATGSLEVEIFAAVTATATSGGCAASISQDCPEFTAEWTDTGFGSGSGFNYTASTASSGSVQFTVTNPNAPAGCASAAFTADYDCQANCPSVLGAQASASTACSGESVNFSVDLSDEVLAEVSWTAPDNSTADGTSFTLVTNATACSQVQQVSYSVICVEDGSTLDTGTFEVAVYAPITANVTNGGCSASVSLDCPSYFASWNDGSNSGDGATYTAGSNTNGTVTFTISHSGAPAGCETATFEASYNCAADCPTFVGATASATEVCDGASISIDIAVSDLGVPVVDWSLPDGSNASGLTLNTVAASSTGCNETLSYGYTIFCEETGEQVASGAVEVMVYGNPSATVTDGGCAALLNLACPEFSATWDDGSQTGSGSTYNAETGTSGSVSFAVSNPGSPDCPVANYSANYDCTVDCPSVVSVLASTSAACDGESITLTANVTDESNATISWSLADGGVSGSFEVETTASTDQCSEILNYDYSIFCLADGSLIGEGTVSVDVYSAITATVNDGTCETSVSADCPGYSVSWSTESNSGEGDTYTAEPGTSGLVTFTITNNSAPGQCSEVSFEGNYSCDALCPQIIGSTLSTSSVCEGEQISINYDLTDAGASAIWTLPDGSTQTGLSITDMPMSGSGCAETLTYEVTVTCDQTGEVLEANAFIVDVFVDITGVVTESACGVSLALDCAEFSSEWSTEGESGIGNSYGASAGNAGTVTFTVTQENAGVACSSETFTGSFDCPENVACPVLQTATASVAEVCDGGAVSFSAVLDDASLGGVTWFYPDGSSSTGTEGNSTLNLSGTCSETQLIDYLVVCDDTGETIAAGSIEVDVLAVPSAVVSGTDCNVSLSQDCPEFVASWSEGGNSGTGFNFSANPGASGEVVFTVTNPAAPDGCAVTSYTQSFSCPENIACPIFESAEISASSACVGETLELTAIVDDSSLATITWVLPDGSTVSGANAEYTATSLVGCTEVQSIAYSVICNDTGETVATGNLDFITVYTTPSAQISGAACNISVTQDCPEYTSSWSDGENSGTGFSYTAGIGTSGSVTFTIENASAPAGCSSFQISQSFDCPVNCPIFVEANASSDVVCAGDEITLSAATTNNANAEILWTLPGGDSATGFTFNTVVGSADQCNETIAYGYQVNCLTTSEILAEGQIEVQAYGNPNGQISGSACSVSLTQECPEYIASWSTEGGATGTGFAFTAGLNQSGSVTFVIENPGAPEACSSTSIAGTFDCQANCPAVLAIPSSLSSCSGETVSLLASVEEGGSVSWTLPGGETVLGQSIELTALNDESCQPVSQDYSYMVVCDEDGSTLAEGQVTITVYPDDIVQYLEIESALDCLTSVIVQPGCESVITVDPAAQDGPEGSAGVHSYDITYNYGASGLDCGYPSSLDVEYDCPLSCNAAAGTVASLGGQSVCIGTDVVLAFEASGQTIPDGGQYDYIIVNNETGLVVSYGPTADISDVLPEGIYCVHGVSHDGSYQISIGDSAPTELSGDCFSISACASAGVVDCGGCAADAGTLKANDSDVCSNEATIGATTDVPPLVPDGFAVTYVLTTGDDLVILQTSDTAEFSDLGVGAYTIHTLVYDPTTLDLSIVVPGTTTGFDVNALLEQGGGDICASLLVAGAAINIYGPVSAGSDNSVTLCNGPDGDLGQTVDLTTLLDVDPASGIWDLASAPEGSISGTVFDAAGLPEGSDYILPFIVAGNAGCEDDFALISIAVQGCIASCDVSAGTLAADAETVCADDGSISASVVNAANVPDGYQTIYVLTQGAELTIIGTAETAAFDALAAGAYTIHSLVYDPTTLDLGIVEPGVTTGFDVNSLLLQGGGEICAALDVTGAGFSVVEQNDAGEDQSASVCSAAADGGATVDLASFVTGDGTWDLSSAPEGSIEGSVFSGEGLEVGTSYNFVYSVSAVSACLADEAIVTVTVIDCSIPCEVSAGSLEASGETDVCVGSDITATVLDAPVVPVGSQVLYVLTIGDELVIQGTSSDPQFTLETAGSYTIHTLVYNSATLDLSVVEVGVTTGVDVLNLIVDGEICADLLVAGPTYSASDAPEAGEGQTVSVCNDDSEGEATIDLVSLPSVDGGEWDLSAAPDGSLEGSVFSGQGLQAGASYDFIYTVASVGPCPDASAVFTVNINDCAVECTAAAGSLSIIGEDSLCEDNAVAQAEAIGAEVPAGSSIIYVLTSGDDLVIEQVADVPEFAVTAVGSYTIHALVYDPATLDLGVVEIGTTTGVDVLNLITDNGLCADLLVDGAQFSVAAAGNAGSGQEATVCVDPENGGTSVDLATLLSDGIDEGDWDLSAAPEGSIDGSVFNGEGLDLGDYLFAYTVAGAGACADVVAEFVITVADCSGPEVSTINGNVFNDVNNNGVKDTEEFGIAGALIVLTVAGPDGELGTIDDIETETVTDAAGDYSLETLNYGEADIQINTPSPFSSTVETFVIQEGEELVVDYPAVALDCVDPIVIVVETLCNDVLLTYQATVTIEGGNPIFNGDAYSITGSIEGEFDSEFVIEDLSYDSTLTLNVTDNAGCDASYELLPDPCEVPNAIELLSFEGDATDEGNLLQWATSSEIGNDYFTLTRSSDGLTFEEIAVLPSRGNANSIANYEFLDSELELDKYYYQLKATDLDGTETLSNVVTLSTRFADTIVSILPNPVSTSLIVDYQVNQSGIVQIMISDILGRTLSSLESETERGLNSAVIDVSNLPAGVYFVSVINGEMRNTSKLIKE